MTTSVVPKHWCDRLEDVDACDDAVTWARTQPSPEAAWQNCDRGDWMLWIIGRAVHAAAEAARAARAAWAAEAAKAANDRFVALRQCADIVRKHYPHPPEFP